MTSFNAYKYITTISKNGYIKKSSINEYNVRAKKGTAAVRLGDEDTLIGVYLSMSDEDKVFIVNNNGYYNFYPLSELSCTGRVTKGVKAIKLLDTEYIKSATLIKSDIEYKGILTITTEGRGKITSIKDFNETSRGVRGNKVMELKDEEFSIVYAVPENQEKIFVSANNKAVVINIDNIPIQNRVTSGIRIIDARGAGTNIEIM
jgi:DNA gyrase subunit A